MRPTAPQNPNNAIIFKGPIIINIRNTSHELSVNWNKTLKSAVDNEIKSKLIIAIEENLYLLCTRAYIVVRTIPTTPDIT